MDAARRDALVRRFENHADALRLQHVEQRIGDLHRHLFLDLQALRERIDEARELRDAHDAMVRQICDVRAADDRHHMVLAIAFEADVLQHDHFVVAVDLAERAREDVARFERVAGEELLVGAHDARRRIDEPLALRIVAGPPQQHANGRFGFVAARPVRGRAGRLVRGRRARRLARFVRCPGRRLARGRCRRLARGHSFSHMH
ncbi:hypothetical protein DP43_3672 [Burkholderia pseudomallei]|nr:hypothetical protein DP43_3672 [Burkholderia pseudomallei]